MGECVWLCCCRDICVCVRLAARQIELKCLQKNNDNKRGAVRRTRSIERMGKTEAQNCTRRCSQQCGNRSAQSKLKWKSSRSLPLSPSLARSLAFFYLINPFCSFIFLFLPINFPSSQYHYSSRRRRHHHQRRHSEPDNCDGSSHTRTHRTEDK